MNMRLADAPSDRLPPLVARKLESFGLTTTDDIANRRGGYLLRHQNFGRKSLADLRDFMCSLGYPDDWFQAELRQVSISDEDFTKRLEPRMSQEEILRRRIAQLERKIGEAKVELGLVRLRRNKEG